MKVGEVVGLRVYPVKGLRGVELQISHVEYRGLRYDRRWMLVDGDRTFLSQRGTPQMACFSVEILENGLNVSRTGFGSIHVPASAEGVETDVTVWRSVVRARRVSSEADHWFSEALEQPCSLVAMTACSDRPVRVDFSRPGDQVSFADGFPLLLANAASLDDLNARLEAPVPMNRFRPNVVVRTAHAWAEDEWRQVRIGPVAFRAPRPCGRCLVTTTDQETGERGTEPLRTLATFRQVGQSINFGVNLIPDAEAEIRVGDDVMAG
ncbi:MAG: MOSC domain-containing protein [Fimbriimonadaceae bacterium]